MKNSLHFLMFIMIAFLFANCKKEQPTHYKIPDELKQLSVFNKGSYWIYINEKTSAFDSTYLEADPDCYTLGINDKEEGPLTDVCNVNFTSSFLKYSTTQFDGIKMEFNYGDCISYYIKATAGQKYISGDRIFELVSYFDSLSLNNKFYKAVFYTRYSSTLVNGDTLTYNCYIAKNLGLIKLEKKYFNADTTWSLVRSNILQ